MRKTAYPFFPLAFVLAWLQVGCEVPETREFQTTLQLRDARTQAKLDQAYLVRILQESQEQLGDTQGIARGRRWVHKITILPVSSGSEVTQPALKKVEYLDLMHSRINNLAFEYSLWRKGYAARRLTPAEVEGGRLELEPIESLASHRPLWRMCEYFEREVLAFLAPDAEHRRALLEIVRGQLLRLREGGMGALGVEGRLSRIEAALDETIQPPPPEQDR
jgi:hypothetical protein